MSHRGRELKAAAGWVLFAALSRGVGGGAPGITAPPGPATAEPGTAQSVAQPAPFTPWWRRAVFYEIFVRSFADSSSGPLAGDGIGDLAGLIERLDYLNDGDPETDDDLGVGGLWLMPVAQSPSYHGYDVSDYYTIEEDYGSNEEFRRLIREAHRRGIRVIVDLVLNHTSREHPWFHDAWRPRSPYHDWYLWAAERQDYRGPWGQLVWHQLPWWQRGWRHFDYLGYYGIFSPAMPDLNHRNDRVFAAVRQIARFWLEEMGADGFRLDAVRHLVERGPVQQDTPETHDWLRRFQAFVHRVDPEALTVGEVWADLETVAAYGVDELDLTFQFDLAEAMLEACRWGENGKLRATHEGLSRAIPGGRYATFLSNHDQVRVMSRLEGDRGRARAAAALLLTGPGVPFIYYGEEIGMHGAKPDPLIRRPMQWSPGRHAGFSSHRPWQRLDPGFAQVNVALQSSEPDSLLSWYRRLIRLRNAEPLLQEGDFEAVETGNPAVYAFRRGGRERGLLVVINLSGRPIGDYGLEWSPAAPSAPVGRELLHGAAVAPLSAADVPYRPLETLAPASGYVIRFIPAGSSTAGGD